MKKRYSLGLVFATFFGSHTAQAGIENFSSIKATATTVSFEENKGQVKDQNWLPRPDVLFSGSTEGMNYFLRKDGVSYQFVKQEISDEIKQLPLDERMKRISETPTQIYRVDVNWKNTNKNFSVEKVNAFSDVNNYYNVPAGMQPAMNVKKYGEVWLRNVWNGVDMHYFSRNGVLESDWVLARAADYTNISFEVKGAELSVYNGELVMKTPFGTIREGALKSFQDGKEITTKWNVEGRTVRLQLENFNPEKPITIDPPTRAWATYYGGDQLEAVWGLATDTSNNVIATGRTTSAGNIATSGAHLTTFNGGMDDAMIVKFNSNGVRQWGTYFGGTGVDVGRGIATNNSSFIFVTGWTRSATGVSTAGTQQTTHSGTGFDDAFLVMFDPLGNRIWGTYYGGASNDAGYACAVSGSTVYMVGETNSASGISSAGAHQSTINNGNLGSNYDAMLIKFNVPTGLRVWGTYVGTTSNDYGRACAVDATGNVYVGGYATSPNVNSGIGMNLPANNSGYFLAPSASDEGIVAKYNANGSFIWSGFIGGSGIDRIYSLATDAQKNVIAVGYCSAVISSFATGSYQPVFGGTADAILIKTDSLGTRLWRTYYGANFSEIGWACAVDANNNILLVGETGSSSNILASTGAHQTTAGGGTWDGMVAVFNPAGSRTYASYYGGSLVDEPVAGAFDKNGAFYFGGITTSTSGISTVSAHQSSNGGNTDGFVVKFDPHQCPSATPIQITPEPDSSFTTICVGQTVGLVAVGSGSFYNWSNGGTTAGISVTPSVTTAYTVTVTDADGCTSTGTKTVNVVPIPTAPTSITGPDTVCANTTVTFKVVGGANFTSYQWTSSGAGNISAQAGDSVQVFVPSGGTISLNVRTFNATNNCNSSSSFINKQVVSLAAQSISIAPASATICSGQSVTLTANGGSGNSTYAWNNSAGTTQSVSVSPTTTTAYTVIVTTSGCSATATRSVTVNQAPTAGITPATVTICNGQSATLTASGGGTYEWSNGGGTNAAATFSPTTNTTYTVTVTGANNCSATASRLVTVNAVPTASISPATVTICSGQSTTLTASGGGTYSWSNSGGSNAAATFSPTTNTTYTVTVTNANNCTSTASRLVTVNTSPTASITPATVTICSGESATLTATGGGTYAWSNGGGSNAAATFSPTTNTTYTVTVTNASNCTATASRLVTVNANPTASISPASASICNGGSQTLTASGGGTYAWSNSLGSGASKSVSPTSTTTYTVTVTNAANCTATASATVTVNTVNAAINGPTTICSGLQATLTASGGTSYAWSNSGGSNAAATFTPTQTTTYTVTVTGAGNCTATASQTVSVQSAPTASITGPTEVCAGSSVTLTANGGNTYTWANSLGTNAAITVSPTATTTYTVTVSIGVNCTASTSQTVTVKQPSASSISETICFGDSYTFKNLQLTQSGTYRDTLTNAVGCDSVITLNLTVRNKIENVLNASICSGQSYTFKGQQLTQAGQYFDTLQSALGCDSFVTLNLAVNSFVTGTVTASICQGQSYAFNGQQLTQGGQYNDILTSSGGCDSIVTLTLTVNSLPQPTITQNGNVLSTQAFTNYQWQLNNGNINNATSQSYTATQSGNYTVLVTDANGCSNTSSALNVTIIGVSEIASFRSVLYPNPTTNVLYIECSEEIQAIEVADVTGRIIITQTNLSTLATQLSTDLLAEATYFIHIKTTSGKTAVRSFVKQ